MVVDTNTDREARILLRLLARHESRLAALAEQVSGSKAALAQEEQRKMALKAALDALGTYGAGE